MNSRYDPALALKAVEARLAALPGSIELQFERAGLLATLGQSERAKRAYLEILRLEATHFGALNNFGVLLHETGFSAAARTVYAEAVKHHPETSRPRVNLANLLFQQGEFAAAREHYETALRLDPANAAAHRGLSAVFQEEGDEARMMHHRERGFRGLPMRTFPYLGDAEPVPLLLLASSAGGDLPWPRLVDDRIFLATTLAASFHSPETPLPPHSLIFNVIGDADFEPGGPRGRARLDRANVGARHQPSRHDPCHWAHGECTTPACPAGRGDATHGTARTRLARKSRRLRNARRAWPGLPATAATSRFPYR